MKTESEWKALRLMLEKVNMGRNTVSESEIVEIIADGDRFPFQKEDPADILREFEEKKLICKSGEGVYSIIADVATLRKAVLAFGEKKGTETAAQEKAPMELKELLDSEWTIDTVGAKEETDPLQTSETDASDSVDLDADDEEEMAETRAYLAARREELMQKMREMAEENDKIELEEIGDDDDDDDDMPFDVFAISMAIEEGATVSGSEGEYYLVPADLMVGGEKIRFRIVLEDEEAYLSDDGFAMLTLKKHMISNEKAVKEQVDLITSGYGIVTKGLELRILVDEFENATSRMMELYAAVERIITLDEEAVVSAAEYRRENEGIWDVVKQILTEDPDLEREALVLRMQEGYQAVKDGENIDDIILYARAVKEFSKMSDGTYSLCRNLLLGNGQEPATEKTPSEQSGNGKADGLSRGGSASSYESTLSFRIGQTAAGKTVHGDMKELRHILIGGMSGSGKSTLLRVMLYCFMLKYTPDEVRFILCDAQGSFLPYRGIPHLVTGQIVTKTEELVRALRWANGEMERRYQLLKNSIGAGKAVKDIDTYNATRDKGEKMLPRILIVVDNYESFAAEAKHAPEDDIRRLVQKAYPIGIHLVLATQAFTPLRSLCRIDFPTRIAFRVYEEAESYAILRQGGAEGLNGDGDMVMWNDYSDSFERLQATYIPPEDAVNAVQRVKRMYAPKFDEQAKAEIYRPETENGQKGEYGQKEAPIDPLYLKALAIVVQNDAASISLVQRKCGIGYNHAGKIIEWMESMGYISSFDGRSGRKVNITKEQFIKRFGSLEAAERLFQDDAPEQDRAEEKIKKMIAEAPRKREDLTVSLGEYSAFGFGIRVYIDYGKDIAYKRVNSPTDDSCCLLSIDIPDFVRRLREIVASWEHEMVDHRILDGMQYHVTFCKNGKEEAAYSGSNKFPANYGEFAVLLHSLE